MQEEYNKRPMVDVVGELTKRVIVMSGDQYVYMDDKKSVESSFLQDAAEVLEHEEVEFYSDKKVSEYKTYLDSTDKKVIPYYEFEVGDLTLEEYVAERKVARDFIRSVEI